MLVLSRKSKEAVIIGSSEGSEGFCKVTVLEIKGDRVRLGFELDRSVPVHRHELWERIHAPECPVAPTREPVCALPLPAIDG